MLGTIADLLATTEQMTGPARSAVRRELADQLAIYDGPPVAAEIWAGDGTATFSIAPYLATAPAGQVADLLDEHIVGMQAREQILHWYSRQPGHALHGLADELIVAAAELSVFVLADDVRCWLAARRPDALPEAS